MKKKVKRPKPLKKRLAKAWDSIVKGAMAVDEYGNDFPFARAEVSSSFARFLKKAGIK